MNSDSEINAKVLTELTNKTTVKSKIDPVLYERYNVKRGLAMKMVRESWLALPRWVRFCIILLMTRSAFLWKDAFFIRASKYPTS